MKPTFLNPPQHFALAEYRAYVFRLPLGAWRPKFPVLHNTGVPSLAQWERMGATPQERWGASLDRYYLGMGWHAGPHAVACPDYAWALCDLMQPGVQASCFNGVSVGLEMVGNYEIGGDDFHEGDGAKVRDNAAMILAIWAEKFGWDDLSHYVCGERGLHFHCDCERDHHACPGSKVTRADMMARVAEARTALQAMQPVVMALPDVPPLMASPAVHSRILTISDLQAALNRLGVSRPLVTDGVLGGDYSLTRAAVKRFQAQEGLRVDGIPGPVTVAAIEAKL